MYELILNGLSQEEVEDLGSAADELYELSNLKKELAKKEKDIVGRMMYLKRYVLDNMPDDNLTGISGKKGFVASVIKEIPVVSDWPEFYTYIIENNRMDLMQKRLGIRSCLEALAEVDNIPGVEIKELVDLSIKKNR